MSPAPLPGDQTPAINSSPKRIFITGGSGCVGHYIVETLMENTSHELYLLLRNPDKLKIKVDARPGIKILQGDLKEIERYAGLLATMDIAILTAAAWGGEAETLEVNVTRPLQLMGLLNPDRCQQVIYFSTASILGHNNQPLPEAHKFGTEYIRSKYLCHQQLQELAISDRVTTIFPTLVFGGDQNKPYSFISAGLSDVARLMGLIRFFRADGSFHFIHARDIAQVVQHLVEHPPEPGSDREIVVGNPAITVDQAVSEACDYLHQRIFFRIPLSQQLANIAIRVFNVRMAEWDRFCLSYRHFVYQNPVNPMTLGLEPYCSTVSDLLRLSGIA